MPALYELTNQYVSLIDLAEEEISEELVAFLNGLVGDIDAKLAALCRVIRALEATEAAARNEARFFESKARRAANAVDRIKDYMKANLEHLGESQRKVDSVFTVAIQNNPPSLDIYNLDLVPAAFDLPQERNIDTTQIKALLKDGVEIPGCVLSRGTHLRIR